ncbi:hypothetical protein DACRYDRAFT_87592 [Dacryopinax primogenitus]|uniref:Uncharacterized protein n=1 Tax=Dacryopinax primogenitus (strain DJM 731) TaxID=1858805 RepID=M5G898_DACPD|nr:uncharacterized protein DACRYDRAFT_87592 [Dacryopinax primogenitus]EJU04370.1 hypothetical protein DACRYDRAFT_87592 [Dacryopinax primogenitus]
MYSRPGASMLSPSSATVRPGYNPRPRGQSNAAPSGSGMPPDLELFHNFVRWHAPDELLQPWGARYRPPQLNYAGQPIPHDRFSASLVIVEPYGKNAVDVVFVLNRRPPQKRYCVRARVYLQQWAKDERNAQLTTDDVRAAAFRGVQTLLNSPHLEPVEWVTSLAGPTEVEEPATPEMRAENAPSLQWSMSM